MSEPQQTSAPESFAYLMAGIGGALTVPVAAGRLALHQLDDPLWMIALFPWAAALNSLWPLGGGMAVDGTYRVRAARWGFTLDRRRGLSSGLAGVFLMSLVTVGGFCWSVPLFAALASALGLPAQVSPTWATVAGAALALGAVLLRHRGELPLWDWAEKAGGKASGAQVESWLAQVAALETPGGLIGHVWGLGSDVVGLHEHLDALAIIRAAEGLGLPRASELGARAREALARCALPDGSYPVYPGGRGRPDLTARAHQALTPSPAPDERRR